MKTLTLRNIPQDVQDLVELRKSLNKTYSKTIYELLRKIPELERKIMFLSEKEKDDERMY